MNLKSICIAGALALCGCTSGVSIVLTDSTAVDIGTVTLMDTAIPMVGYHSGPRAIVSVHRDALVSADIEGAASITNRTTVIGVYTGDENKQLRLRANIVPKAE